MCNKILSKNYEINFFAGGGAITLISEFIEAVMHDLGASWNVKHISKHKIWILIYLVILNKTTKEKGDKID